MNLERVAVEAVVGEANAPRPAWVTWNGQRTQVTEIEGQWRESGRTLFRVRLESGERLLLAHRDSDGSWAAVPAVPGHRPGST